MNNLKTTLTTILIIIITGIDALGSGYHNKILEGKVSPWISRDPTSYGGVYKSVDWDDTLESWIHIRPYSNENGELFLSIVIIDVAEIMMEPTYKITKGKIVKVKDGFLEVICLDGERFTMIKYMDPASNKMSQALKIGKFVYRKI